MEMKANIRIFRILFRDGIDWRFKIEEQEGIVCPGDEIFNSIEELAKYTNVILSKLNKETHTFYTVSIDFKPYHDIEDIDSALVQRCKPLTEDQEEEFWELFNKPNILIFDDEK